MNQSNSQIILFCLVFLLVIILSAISVEHYLFSWTGFLSNQVGLCDYKTVRAVSESSGVQKPTFDFDTQYIAAEMMKKSNYEVKGGDDVYVVVKRKFGNVTYGIMFYGQRSLDTGFIFFTGLDADPINKTPEGESYATPNRVLRNNIFAIIDDLPLIEQQKNEMKGYARVRYTSTGKLW